MAASIATAEVLVIRMTMAKDLRMTVKRGTQLAILLLEMSSTKTGAEY